MKIVKKKISDLIFSEYNPRKLTDKEEQDLTDSIKRFGIVDPIIINRHPDRKNIVIGGHQRIKVALKLEYKEIPCVEVEMDRDRERELNIRLNKNNGSWDWDLLEDNFELEELIDWGFEEEELDFDIEESGLIEDDEIPEVEEPVCKKGDLWKLGDHRLLCGDATDKGDVDRLMGGEKADMVFTDPPYNVNYEYNEYKDNKSDEEYLGFCKDFYKQINDNIQDGGVIYIMSGDKYLLELGLLFKEHFRFSQILFWVKDNPTLGNSDYQYNYEALLYGWNNKSTHKYYGGNVEPAANFVDRDRGAVKTEHKAQRPIKLVCDYILNSCQKEDIVLDLFLGSGSTLIACEKTNRKCYGMEIDEHYCDVIINRWEEYTGKKAEKIG